MKKFKGIDVIATGEKYQSPKGFSAIKNGQKSRVLNSDARLPKPSWLKVPLPSGSGYLRVKQTVKDHDLATVCEESMCPNIGECWSHGTATIMLMGDVCTRACRFCAVDTGNPKGWLDLEEPIKTAKSVSLMDLNYIVLTSVDRDDLDDGGAKHYADTIRAIKDMCPHVTVEALTPDFSGDQQAVEQLIDAGVDVFAQNIETVKRLTHVVRDKRAGYEQTLKLLEYAKQYSETIITKTSIMVGIGEMDDEIIETFRDLKVANVDIVTLGQYLQPTKFHLPIDRYVSPESFKVLRDIGLDFGFMEVVAGPLVRSSYRADQVFNKNNVGLTGTHND